MTAPTRQELSFALDGIEPGMLRPLRLEVHEELSDRYQVKVLLRGDGAEVHPSALLFKVGEIIVSGEGGELRRFCGIVTRARERVRSAALSRGVAPAHRQHVDVVLESPLALLAMSSDFRIFQEMTTIDIIKKVFEEHGVPAEQLDVRATAKAPRITCTQAGERTADFVSRLLEEDGIFHFCESDASGFRLVLADKNDAGKPLAEPVPYRPASGLVANATAAISEIAHVARVTASKITVGDHDFTHPALDLREEITRPASVEVPFYDFPAGHLTQSDGKARATARRDAFAADARYAEAKSHVFTMAAGVIFELEGTATALDRKWLVRRAVHRWADEGGRVVYDNELVLLPHDQPFRPAPKTKRPVLAGPQVAIVTGPSGEDVHCDKYGRVKVRFPWDRRAPIDDKSSGWVRVLQLSMGGAIAIPRVGWEVLVEFEHGDPDRPVVIGRLYNARYMPPFALPQNRTSTTFGSYVSPGRDGENLVRIDDASGEERIRIHAQKDLELSIEENLVETVISNESVGVIGMQTIKVKGDQSVSIDKNAELRIGGKQTWTVKGARELTVDGERTVTIAKDRALTIATNHERTIDKSDTLAVKGALSETVGGALTMKADKEIRLLIAKDAKLTIGGLAQETSDDGRSELVLGSRTEMVAAGDILMSGKDLSLRTKGDRSLTVGAAVAYSAGGKLQIGSSDQLSITIGGAMALSGASAIVLKAGSSTVTISSGAVVLKSSKIKLTASGPNAQLAGIVADK